MAPEAKKRKTTEEEEEEEEDGRGGGENLFNRLPNKLVCNILSYLSHPDIVGLVFVDRRLRGLSETLRKSLRHFTDLSTRQVRTILRHSRQLETLEIDSTRRDRTVVATHALQHCQNLRTLISRRGSARKVMEAIERRGKKVSCLHLLGATFERGQDLQAFERMTEIELVECEGVDDDFLLAMSGFCDNLKSLDLTIGEDMSSASATGAVGMRTLLRSVRGTLEELALDFLNEAEIAGNIALIGAIGKCRHLKVLKLDDASGLNPEGLRIISSLPALTSLRLCYFGYNDLHHRDYLSAFSGGRLTRLTHLDIGNNLFIGDASIIVITRNCPDLKSLQLRSCKRITNKGVRAAVYNCRKLELLCLRKNRNVTRNAFVDLEAFLPNLRALDIILCSGIDGEFQSFLKERYKCTSCDTCRWS